MNIVLLSGGSGKRLWPLSNDIRSKQFIKIFKNQNEYESMVQRVFRQIKKADHNANITIATSKSQVSSIFNQIGNQSNICVEPCRRDTFAAIVLATLYLKDKKGLLDSDSIVICPVDPYVEDDYFEAIKKLESLSSNLNYNLMLMGIEPTYPSEKYGYIIPETNDSISKVSMFKEKPNTIDAKKYIQNGALWNSGVFVFKIGYLLDRAHELIDFKDYDDLLLKYETLERISFDYAVVENETSIGVMRFNGDWKDIGTWNTLAESMDENIIGKAILNETCNNVHVLNELDVPVLCMGLSNIIVATSSDGILVSDKEQSSYIKPYVDGIDQQIMFAEKSWGSFRVIDVQKDSMTIKVILNENNQMNYHSHQNRDEVWTVTSGQGRVVIDGLIIDVYPGNVLTMKRGTKHTIMAKTKLELIEVQIGENISVDDKQKFSLEGVMHDK